MFNFIIGDIVEVRENALTLLNNNIGYDIYVSTNTLSNLKARVDIKIYTYLQVRDDGITMFGFSNLQERELFLQLISISGIGAKVAISVLSGMTVNNLVNAIINGDTRLISSAKGIGKKTAERIVLELRSKLIKGDGTEMDFIINKDEDTGTLNEAVNVLVSLGISRIESNKIVSQGMRTGLSDIEDIIAYSLKNLNR